MKIDKIQVVVRGRVQLMPHGVFADYVSRRFSGEQDKIALGRLTFTARPDKAVTNVTFTFYSKEHEISKQEAQALAKKLVTAFLEKYNAGEATFGFADIRNVRGGGSQVFELLEFNHNYQTIMKTGILCAVTYVHVVFNHTLSQLSLF